MIILALLFHISFVESAWYMYCTELVNTNNIFVICE